MNVAKLAAVFQLGGDDWEPAVVTMHVTADDSRDPFSEDDLTALGTSVFKWWTEDGPYTQGPWFFGNSAAAFYPPQVELQTIEAERVEPDIGPKVFVPGENWAGEASDVTVPQPLVGTLRIRPLPPQVAVCIKLNSNVEERRARGRMFWPACQIEVSFLGIDGWSPAAEAVGRIPEGHVNHLGAMAQNLAYWIRNTTEDEGEFGLAVYSRTYHEVRRVITADVQRWFRTQRPRQVEPGGYATFDVLPS